MRTSIAAAVVLAAIFLFTQTVAGGDLLLIRSPTLSKTQIVFVYADDLWIVAREGGEARRLTTGSGSETNPFFSPDGSLLAFSAEYDGNVDVYTVPATGGIPRRITYHPGADLVAGWTPDGKRILFSSSRVAYANTRELFTVGVDGGYPERLPFPIAYEGSFNTDGSRIAYVPMRRAFQAWKRYRGGTVTPIWLGSLSDSSIEKIPHSGSNDYCPMWVGNKVYFLSDRSGPVSLFCYDTQSKQVKEMFTNTGLDLKSASAGPNAIVMERFGALYLYDIQSGKQKQISVTVAGDWPGVRDRLINVGRRLARPSLSPNAARVAFEARGEIVTVPAEKGNPRNLTNTTGVMERFPVWSPDGKTIAYFSDEAGEYALHLAPQTGMGPVTKIDLPEPGFYSYPAWAPDSKKISFVDSRLRIWYLDIESKKTTQVDRESYWNLGNTWAPVWSPDSRWLAYAKRLPNYMYAIHLYSLADGKATRVTDGMSDARYPVWDKGGKYLYFSASTDAGPSLQPDVGAFARPVSRSLYLIVLAKEEPSPFAPESDEEKGTESPKSGIDEAKETKPEKTGPDDAKTEKSKPPEVKIDFDKIGQRILALPMPARRYVGLDTGKTGILFTLETPAQGTPEPSGYTVHRYDLKLRKADIAIRDVTAFEVARNGEKMLYSQKDNWYIGKLPPPPPAASSSSPAPSSAGGSSAQPLTTSGIEVKASPRAEWKQMYAEAWRIERDFFYDPGYHGLDLKAAEKLYLPYLDGLASRSDLNYLFAEMLGNMVVGHLSVGGGDLPAAKTVQTGMLGCDFQIENGRYRFRRVFDGENWNPDLKAPLTQPGVNVAEGEYLLAVNGRNLTSADNVYSLLEGTVDKQAVLRVGPDPSGSAARDVTVLPIANDYRLRHLAWIEGNRRQVDQMTGGRVAYVHLPDTSGGGFRNFNRYFYAQVEKEAVIVDERYNGGGALATDIIEQLSRKLMSSVASRDGGDEVEPQGLIRGPKTMLINEYAGSGGDAMPFYFRKAKIGPLIGKRTWGGLIGRAVSPSLMDGGYVTAPSSGVWDPEESRWIAENIGISPDIEVEHDPQLVRQGRDPQLERAVAYILEELKKNPVKPLVRPAYPKYKTLP